jgi:cation:H+ antiporter
VLSAITFGALADRAWILARTHVTTIAWLALAIVGTGAIVWGAETFAEHLSVASVRLGVSAFALAILLAGAEPEELATAVTASLRKAPAIALGDVIGANIAICLVALGVGAVIAPLPFDRRVRRYALAGIPAGVLAAAIAWDGEVNRPEGVVLLVSYVLFVAVIWTVERQPPALGEAGELEEAQEHEVTGRGRVGRELMLVLAGVGAMALGASALVESIRRISGVESTQARLGLIVVGFATAFELVVLAWSAARRGITAAVVAGVVGSFTYNATMTLGAGALARPLHISDAQLLRGPWIIMVGALVVVVALAWRAQRLDRRAGIACLALYPIAVGAILLVT